MNKIARKYFLPVLFGSVLVFAIDYGHADMAAISTNSNSTYTTLNHFNKLDDDNFWGKFRESVMKDRDKNDPNDDGPSEPSRGGEPRGGNDRGGPGGHGGGHNGGPR